ncbi:TetR/AcrR family transcriptional regulator [Saccharopolyspora shandongensis]|uniref:TetR/AcrR family transcriptional regulator n=1 Tax=Saccharopolyspora shandongensis TaxID=418495 RepID=UPI0033D51187
MASSRRVTGERQRRRRARSGILLSADTIIDCALRLSQEHGPDGLSARRLGVALGCDPSALYRYFHNTDDLLLAIADRLIGQTMESFQPSEDWVASLRELAHRIRATYQAQPRVAALLASRVTRRENEFRAVETGLSLFLQAGFDARTAVRHYHAFIDTVLGHVALDATALALPKERYEADSQAWANAYQALPADTYPAVAAVRHELPRMAGPSFDNAVELMLAAIAAQAPSNSAQSKRNTPRRRTGRSGQD